MFVCSDFSIFSKRENALRQYDNGIAHLLVLFSNGKCVVVGDFLFALNVFESNNFVIFLKIGKSCAISRNIRTLLS